MKKQPRAKPGTAYVITEDLSLLVRRWCDQAGIPVDRLTQRYFNSLFKKLKQALTSCCFKDNKKEVQDLSRTGFDDLLHKHDGRTRGKKPREFWVSLDDVYVEPTDCESKYNISVTRYVQRGRTGPRRWKKIGYGPRPEGIDRAKPISLNRQIRKCLEDLKKIQKGYGMPKLPVVLVDDGTFDGGTITNILDIFASKDHPIQSVRLGVGTTKGLIKIADWRYPRRPRKGEVRHTVPFIGASKLCPPILDWVCERDFFPGVLYSGKVVGVKKDGKVKAVRVGDRRVPVRAQYLAGWGDIKRWATLTTGTHEFTIEALKLSIKLWKRIEKVKKDRVLVQDLPAIPYRIYDPNPARMRSILQRRWVEVLEEECDKMKRGNRRQQTSPSD